MGWGGGRIRTRGSKAPFHTWHLQAAWTLSCQLKGRGKVSRFLLQRESGDSESCSGASLIPWTFPALRCQTGGDDQSPAGRGKAPLGALGQGVALSGSRSGHLCHGPPLPWRLKGQVWGRRSRSRPSEAKGSSGKCRRDTPALGDSLQAGWGGTRQSLGGHQGRKTKAGQVWASLCASEGKVGPFQAEGALLTVLRQRLRGLSPLCSSGSEKTSSSSPAWRMDRPRWDGGLGAECRT